MHHPIQTALLLMVATAAAVAGPVETAIVAAMQLPDAPNYSWQTEVADDARTYEIVGSTDRATDYSLVTMPLATTGWRRGPRGAVSPNNVATVVFKGAEDHVVQVDETWRKPNEMSPEVDRGGGRRSGGFGGPPGMGGPPGGGGQRGRSSRGGGRFPGGEEPGPAPAYSNLQNTLSRPHEEVAIIVAGAADLKVDGEVVTGSLAETSATLLLVHAGQKDITPLRASGTFRLWVREGTLAKYETTLEGKLAIEGSSGRREVAVHQKATTTLSKVGTTKVDVPAEAKKKLGG